MKSLDCFTWQVVCRAGVLCSGVTPDFLTMFSQVKTYRDRYAEMFPGRSVRTALYYTSGERISIHDIKAALRALADKRIAESVAARALAAQQARFSGLDEGRLARHRPDAENALFSGKSAHVFCQASVVAPPDSPDLGNLHVLHDNEKTS
ncbi:hypothetical protein ACO0LO_24425 [Undibacterium sp. TJN25]|uniref:hypothetical protein n=1 Tax=Undibacterium sp. TJN25 TaxID=3413056 RepID=UPI003BF0E706